MSSDGNDELLDDDDMCAWNIFCSSDVTSPSDTVVPLSSSDKNWLLELLDVLAIESFFLWPQPGFRRNLSLLRADDGGPEDVDDEAWLGSRAHEIA